MDGSLCRAETPPEQEQEGAKSWCHLAGIQSWVLLLSLSLCCSLRNASGSLRVHFQFVWTVQGHSPSRNKFVSLWLRFLQPALGQECCLTSGTPTSCPQKWGMCVTVPLAALPRFQSDILLSCQTVMAFAAAELRFWSHLVFLGDGPEHLGPFCTF